MMLPHGLIALSLGTVIFPQLARLHAAGDTAALRETALGAVRQVLFLALPASAILARWVCRSSACSSSVAASAPRRRR